jgi:hypothetical protein
VLDKYLFKNENMDSFILKMAEILKGYCDCKFQALKRLLEKNLLQSCQDLST